jgi:pyridoxamine 5'-phosphate oxidase
MSDFESKPQTPADLRREYVRDALLESEASADPIEQFRRWFADARQATIREPNAMTLATVDAAGAPAARVVLLKGFDDRGFTFFTNYVSRKGRELAGNPRAALCFFWDALERQVRIEGTVEQVDRAETEAYFASRPRGSQLGAWVSRQSEEVTRDALERELAALMKRFGDGPIPAPDFWGGYRVVPTSIEFWQGRPSRLHDRLQYVRVGGSWTRRRLSP